jgi:hypothetical protein
MTMLFLKYACWVLVCYFALTGIMVHLSGCGGHPYPVCSQPFASRCNGDVPEHCISGHWYPLLPEGCAVIEERCVDEEGEVTCQK